MAPWAAQVRLPLPPPLQTKNGNANISPAFSSGPLQTMGGVMNSRSIPANRRCTANLFAAVATVAFTLTLPLPATARAAAPQASSAQSSAAEPAATSNRNGIGSALTMAQPRAAMQQRGSPSNSQNGIAQPEAGTLGLVTITGSRVITNPNDSPTPIIAVSAATLKATVPSDIPDALNNLPAFVASRNQTTTGGSTINWPGNFINLLGLGSNRTLILLDGMRVPATDSSNDVDLNTLPLELLKRVDIVTGGDSAVYGSDAVAGVINFVLRKHFNGIKLYGQGGISSYGDDASRKFGLIAGENLFHGRGHIEFSAQQYVSNGIPSDLARPLGKLVPMELGFGTAADPYYLATNVRNTNYTPGGYIGSGPLANMCFCEENNILTPFVNGAPGLGPNQIGGDGGFFGESYYMFPGVEANPWLVASLTTNRGFARFDYAITKHIHAFVMANLSQSDNFSVSGPQTITATFAADNAFLPQSARSLLAAGGASSFTMSKALMNDPGGISNGYTQNVNIMTGAHGTLFGYTWHVHYTHGESKLHESSPYTLNFQRLTAAMDAVVNPANGEVVCQATLTAAGAAAYPGCIPFDAFGPSADNWTAFQWASEYMNYTTINKMDDFGGSISGAPFKDWAGAVRTALDAEYRNLSLQTESAYSPTQTVNCEYINPVTCNPHQAVQNGAVANMPRVSENVKEVALEFGIPVVKNLPLFRSVNLNAAARYTSYSTVGSAVTWKLGGVWNVGDQFRIRGSVSRDIGAPTLSDLYAPLEANVSAFTDELTHTSGTTELDFVSNPNLKPEVARTTTIGVVYTPRRFPGLTASVDYYHLRINNEISGVFGGSPTVEALCSEGATEYCLTVRPFPVTDTSPNNYPTAVLFKDLNNGKLYTTLYDADIGDNFPLHRFWKAAHGIVTSRLLFTYQPKLVTVAAVPGSPPINQAGAEGTNGVGSIAAERATLDLGYAKGDLAINAQERYQSSEAPNPQMTYVYKDTSYVPAIYYTNISLSYKVTRSYSRHGGLQCFLSIQNVFNKQPTLFIGPGRTGAEGYAYPAPADENVIGRYFTLGVSYRVR